MLDVLTFTRDRAMAKVSRALWCVPVAVVLALFLTPLLRPQGEYSPLESGDKAWTPAGFGRVESVSGDDVRVRLDSGEVVTVERQNVGREPAQAMPAEVR
jgi:preprotein translocase subunit YajC